MDTRICMVVTGLLGLWTAAAHLCTLAGGSLVHLMIGFTFALLLGLRWWRPLFTPPAEQDLPPAPTGWTLAMVLLGMGVAWLARRPDADDAIYLNLAVTAADHPRAALGSVDGLFGLTAPSPLLRPYALHSLELGAAALRVVTGVPARYFMHAVLPPLAGALVVLAQVSLARHLLGPQWRAGVVLALLVLALVGDGWQSHGHVGLARLHQGKALLLHALLPLVLLATVHLHRKPDARNGLRLWLTGLAAIGCSANGLILVPLLTVITHLGLSGRDAARHPATRWVLLLAVTAVGLSAWALAARGGDHPPAAMDGLTAVSGVVRRGLGNPALAAVTLTLLGLGVWRTGGRAGLAVLTVLVVLVSLNPLVAGELNRNLQREGILARALWLLPLPMLVGAGVLWVSERLTRRGNAVLAAILLVGTFLALPGRHPLGPMLRRPWLRAEVVPPGFAAARAAAVRTTGPVLAPPAVSAWIPTLHHHPPVLNSRPLYDTYLSDRVGAEETRRRRELARWAEGQPDLSPACDDLDVRLVVTHDSATSPPPLLDRCGFRRGQPVGAWVLWERR